MVGGQLKMRVWFSGWSQIVRNSFGIGSFQGAHAHYINRGAQSFGTSYEGEEKSKQSMESLILFAWNSSMVCLLAQCLSSV